MEINKDDLEWGLFMEHPEGPHVVLSITGTRFYIPLILFSTMLADVHRKIEAVVAAEEEIEEGVTTH